MSQAQHVSSTVAHLLECWRVGLIWLDQDCGVIATNAAARRILSLNDALRVRAGQLAIPSKDVMRALREFVREAAATPASGRSFLVRLDRRSRPGVYVLRAWPNFDAGQHGVVFLAIDELTSPNELDPTACRLALGLTPGEARVALRLAAGMSAPKIARELGLSPFTVRTHVKRAFKKVGCHSQLQLVAALSRLALMPNPPAPKP